MISKYCPPITTPLHKPPIIFPTKIPNICQCHHRHTPISLSSFGRHGKRARMPLVLASRGSNDRAGEIVLRLYEALRNKNSNQVSEIIGHDCRCVCNFVSTVKTFNGKKQVMKFFSSLMGCLGNSFEFVIQPTLHDGMTVGVSWKLECRKTHKLVGTGFSFHMCHVYQGKVLIRNVEMFLEPHIEPLGLKMVGLVASIIGQMASQPILNRGRKRAAYVFCSLVVFTILLFIIVKTYRS